MNIKSVGIILQLALHAHAHTIRLMQCRIVRGMCAARYMMGVAAAYVGRGNPNKTRWMCGCA